MQVNHARQQFGDLCSQLVRRLRLLERSEMACCGVPLSQAMVLQTLEANGGRRRMSQVASALGVAQSTATRLVEPLVRQGQVRREAESEDGRVVMIQLTDRGTRTATELQRQAQRCSEAVLQRIPVDQRRVVIAALQAVVEAVKSCCASGCQPSLAETLDQQRADQSPGRDQP